MVNEKNITAEGAKYAEEKNWKIKGREHRNSVIPRLQGISPPNDHKPPLTIDY